MDVKETAYQTNAYNLCYHKYIKSHTFSGVGTSRGLGFVILNGLVSAIINTVSQSTKVKWVHPNSLPVTGLISRLF